jgi:hypothetical protein
MNLELNEFIGDFYAGKTDYEKLPMAPRNYNWHYKGNLGGVQLHRQRQVDDMVNEEIGKNNAWKSIGLSTLEQNQIRKYGRGRRKQASRGYTDKVERLRSANSSYLDRLNILQPQGSEGVLEAELDPSGMPLSVQPISVKFDYEKELNQALANNLRVDEQAIDNYNENLREAVERVEDLPNEPEYKYDSARAQMNREVRNEMLEREWDQAREEVSSEFAEDIIQSVLQTQAAQAQEQAQAREEASSEFAEDIIQSVLQTQAAQEQKQPEPESEQVGEILIKPENEFDTWRKKTGSLKDFDNKIIQYIRKGTSIKTRAKEIMRGEYTLESFAAAIRSRITNYNQQPQTRDQITNDQIESYLDQINKEIEKKKKTQ